MISLENVTKTYSMGENSFQALKGVSLQINNGELVAIIGASGSGKSTMMNIMGLLDRTTTGKYILLGKDANVLTADQQAEYRNRLIGFIFQSFFLLPRLTAVDNVALPLMYRNIRKQECQEKARHYMAMVGMERFSNHRPNELSGGQQQRIAIARALVGEPELILADEPTGALDSKTSDVVMEMVEKINQEQGKTVVIITHDPEVAERCPRVVRLHDGLIEEDA
jgi:putative ABC transport system ATP-binding protein